MTESLRIARLSACEILDSRGNPTVRAEAVLAGGASGAACVPSGASTGTFEAYERRDGDLGRYGGNGVLHAVDAVTGEIAHALCGESAENQTEIDRILCELDGTENKARLGANAILGVSLAVARARAQATGVALFQDIGGQRARRLPCPMMNVLNGGAHAQNNLDIQEFMIAPIGFSRFEDALRAGAETYRALGALLKRKGLACGVGDEGGFAPSLQSDEQALELLCEAIVLAGYSTDQIRLAVDAAATEWVDGTRYRLPKGGREFSADALCKYWEELCDRYPLYSIEDPLGEEDWEAWAALTQRIGGRVQLVGDDLFVTNPVRVERGILREVATAVLIKPNQIGTLSETLRAIECAQKAGYAAIPSHRSGDTEDPFIADLAVAVGAGQIKTGAPCRAERTAKYNRLLLIAQSLGDTALYGF